MMPSRDSSFARSSYASADHCRLAAIVSTWSVAARVQQILCLECLDSRILPGEFPRQRIDLRLPRGGDRGTVRVISFEECAGVRSLATPIAWLPTPQERDDGGHVADDLSIYQIELALSLSARLLHSEKLRAQFGIALHGVSLPCQPMKLEGPS